MLPDVNLLVAAFRKDHVQHAVAAQWLTQAFASASNGQLLRLPVGVLSSFLRLATNAKIFPTPTPVDQAVDFVDWLLEHPNAIVVERSQEWPRLRKMVLDKGLAGNQIPDAQLAALAISLGEPFVTFDKGFRKLLPPSLLVLLAAT